MINLTGILVPLEGQRRSRVFGDRGEWRMYD
jgi:hypothetical protein